MAVTFEEVETFARGTPNANDVLNVPTSLVITQEDGRTCYCAATGQLFDRQTAELSSVLLIAGQPGEFPQYFNDRVAGSNSQGILRRFNNDDTDGLRFQVQRTSVGQYVLKIQVPRWNLSHQVSMQRSPVAKLYTGYGLQIGVGNDKALYALSFQKVELIF
jgi:hypothetical protein